MVYFTMSDTSSSLFKDLAKQLILCVLGETLDKLAILKYINSWSEDDQTTIEYKTIEEQCSTIKNDDVLPPETKDSVDLLDFRRDCSFIESTIRKTFNEIREKGTYVEALKTLTNIFNRLQTEEADLLEDTRKKEEGYMELQNTYYRERAMFRSNIDDVMTKIGNLKDEIEDFEQEADIKIKYLQSWQNSRKEMRKYVLNKKEEETADIIKERQQDFLKEKRVNQEIGNIYKEIDLDFQRKMKEWKLKYERDLEIMNVKINNLLMKKDEQQDKTAAMVKKYIQRQEEIDAYKEHKVEKEKLRLEKERKSNAATKIQAWWRGTMVRKGFGKYKKKKDKKSKKKDEQKK